jgi:entericidin B
LRCPSAAIALEQRVNSWIRKTSRLSLDADDIGTRIADYKSVQLGTHIFEETAMYKLLAGLLAVTFILSGCNTISGAGKDMERGGEKIQDKAEKAKN